MPGTSLFSWLLPSLRHPLTLPRLEVSSFPSFLLSSFAFLLLSRLYS